jgi:hypothetical protein
VVNPAPRKLAIFIAYVTLGIIVVMAAVALVTGATQEAHEHFAAPDLYAARLVAEASPLRMLFALDVAFTILYAVYFTLFASHLSSHGAARALVSIALGAMLATAALDFLEDQHILAMLNAAEHGGVLGADAIAWQVTESGVKFSLSFLSLFAFGLALPRTNALSWVLSLLLSAGSLVNAIAAYALPVTSPVGIEVGRWVGFVVGFVLAIAWLRRQPD